jgi:hypothetical protein
MDDRSYGVAITEAVIHRESHHEGLACTSVQQSPLFCERCGEQLNPDTAVWLELSWKTNRYAGAVPTEESQGWFSFGRACAKAVLANGGKNDWSRR